MATVDVDGSSLAAQVSWLGMRADDHMELSVH